MNESDVLRLVKALGLKGKKSEEWINFSCIFAPWRHDHGTDRSQSAGISINDHGPSKYYCFACTTGGDDINNWVPFVLTGWQWVSGRSLGELHDWVHARYVEDIKKLVNAAESGAPGTSKEPKPLDQVLNEVEVYPESTIAPYEMLILHGSLVDRGITAETARYWGVGFDGAKNRIMFPVRRHDGKLVGLVGRTVVDDEPKYLFYWSFRKGAALFGAQFLSPKITTQDLILVEGTYDAMKVYQAGFRTLAIFGSTLSKNQGRLVERYVEGEVIVFFDGDGPGLTGGRGVHRMLSPNLTVRIVRTPEGEDPGSMGSEQIQELIREAKLVEANV